jgi:myo-inositol catabolism protein IolS
MTEGGSPRNVPAAAGVPPGLGLGCWQFGDMGWGPCDAAASVSLIRGAWEDGIRHFDTAQDYGGGRSEEVLGEAIQPFADRAFVSSKSHPAPRENVASIVEQTLRRLRRGWVDLFYFHWPKTGFDLRPMMEALEDLRRQGKVRLIGVSNFTVADLEHVSLAGRVDAYQLCYNLLWRYPERDILPWCRGHDVAVVTFSSIAQGLLSDTPRSPASFQQGDARGNTLYYRGDVWPSLEAPVAAMRAAASRFGTPLSTIAIRWVLAQPGVHASLVGARSRQQIRQNVAAAATRNSPEMEEEITRLSLEAMRHIPDEGNIFLFHP